MLFGNGVDDVDVKADDLLVLVFKGKRRIRGAGGHHQGFGLRQRSGRKQKCASDGTEQNAGKRTFVHVARSGLKNGDCRKAERKLAPAQSSQAACAGNATRFFARGAHAQA